MRTGSLVVSGGAGAIAAQVAPIVAAVEEALPIVVLGAADAVGTFAVIKELNATSKGTCHP